MPQLIEHLDEFLRGIIPQDVHSRDWEITEKYKVSYLYVLLAQRLIGQLVGSAFFLYEIYYSGGSMDEFFKLIFRGVAFSFTTYFSLNFLLRSKYHQFAMIFFCIWNFVTVFLGGLFMGQELGVMLSAGHVICIPFILFGSDHIHFPLMNCFLVISITLARHYYVVSNSMSFVFDLHSGFTVCFVSYLFNDVDKFAYSCLVESNMVHHFCNSPGLANYEAVKRNHSTTSK